MLRTHPRLCRTNHAKNREKWGLPTLSQGTAPPSRHIPATPRGQSGLSHFSPLPSNSTSRLLNPQPRCSRECRTLCRTNHAKNREKWGLPTLSQGAAPPHSSHTRYAAWTERAVPPFAPALQLDASTPQPTAKPDVLEIVDKREPPNRWTKRAGPPLSIKYFYNPLAHLFPLCYSEKAAERTSKSARREKKLKQLLRGGHQFARVVDGSRR